ncbi:hypothetical protein GQ53DRAFT_815180 [Thozetella sp. PMI_491]|nr:hypothetical protein GQ53DRAFT_815180 [Thozetella sp. PMI_491]
MPRTPDSRSRPSSANANDRRIRKRESDRKSQREHRERQKTYIKQLEDSIKSLTSCQSADERVTLLLEERQILKSRCDDMSSRLARARSILFNDSPADTNLTAGAGSSGDDASALARAGEGVGSNRDEQCINASGTSMLDSLVHINAEPSVLDVSAAAMFATPPLGVSIETIDTPTFNLTEPDLGMAVNVAEDNLAATQDGSDLTTSVELATGQTLGPFGRLCMPCESNELFPEHLQFPRYSPPLGAADRLLSSMVEEALGEHALSNFDTAQPSLRRLLSDNSDILAFRLYHYISSYGAMPLHLLLAIFWVQYLILRACILMCLPIISVRTLTVL